MRAHLCDQESKASPPGYPSQVHSALRDLQQPPAIPSHPELDMHKLMNAFGGPNYETVLRETNIHMGSDSEKIPSERFGGEARRANLKRKAKDIAWSVAETFA